MSFKKRVTKSIALALVGVTIAIPMLNTASAMENSKETYSQKIERVSKSFEDFVYLEDNQYKLDISVSELSVSSKSDFYIYNDYINLLNNIIVSNNIKNVTEDGFSLQISDEMAIESAKINNIEMIYFICKIFKSINMINLTKFRRNLEWELNYKQKKV